MTPFHLLLARKIILAERNAAPSLLVESMWITVAAARAILRELGTPPPSATNDAFRVAAIVRGLTPQDADLLYRWLALPECSGCQKQGDATHYPSRQHPPDELRGFASWPN